MEALVLTKNGRAALTAACLALVLSGCMANRTRPPAPLAAAPSAPVRTAELAPPPQPEVPEAPIAQTPLPGETAPGAETAVASTASPAPSSPLAVGRSDLLGGWAIASGGDQCQLFMSLTTRTGGYRASTRGCSNQQLAGISSWDLVGSTVTLKGGDGAAPVASLTASDSQRFSGSTVDGASITVSR